MKRILVTGGAGFIGTNLVEKLVANNYEVVVIDDLSAGNRQRLPQTITFHKLNICDTKELQSMCTEIDAVVHLAALPKVQDSIDNPQAAHLVNVDGTLSVLEAVRQSGVRRVIFASSSAVYGDQETLPITTDLPTVPKSPYALHKLMGEEMMRLWSDLYDIETVSLRFFNVYGPHFDPDGPYASVIGRFMKFKSEGQKLPITGDGLQTRDFVHVDDVTEAILVSLETKNIGKGEVFNIGSGTEITINKLADIIGGEVEYIEARHEPRNSLADISATKKALSWQPVVDLSTALKDLYQNFSANQ